MNDNAIYIGENKASFNTNNVEAEFVRIENESYYKILNSDTIRPFFMSIVSDSNHWMFISSNGGLSAGRKDCDTAIFPYYTDDKIAESKDLTGSKTILHVYKHGKTYLWEPFTDRYDGIYHCSRNLYKNIYGNKIIFEEINSTLGLIFRYQWNSSDQFGFVKKSTILNNTSSFVQITVLDGIQNIIPYGVTSDLQSSRSNLVDAYKKNELETKVGLGIYSLSAIIVDKAEPSEALKATIAWSVGLENPTHLLSSFQLNNFRKGKSIQEEYDIKAEKGAYFISTDLRLQPKSKNEWMIVADVNQSIASIVQVSERIKKDKNLFETVQKDIEAGTLNLLKLNAASDGLQLTADNLRNGRHFSNTLFNIMRGGVFDNNYQIEKFDFVKYIAIANKNVHKEKEDLLAKFPPIFSLKYLKKLAEEDKNNDFKRLCYEYLPLKFSRRHGDPSRPWNKFLINTRDEIDGSKVLDYEGNWRDIFQNWEALALSYPGFIESMIHKFLNATTFDGYNPYRIMKDGFDWEVIEPDDSWSFIGYWGDHQIIYLLKFLEFIENYYPNKLSDFLNQEIFVYANVPYKIKSYFDILINPKDTIEYDKKLDDKISQEKIKLGADAALLKNNNNAICKVNLIEKLLATVLAKISNFIPEGGIWMNTQRPEWNDANNALVGNGVSMVTLYHLRKFLKFFENIVETMTIDEVVISEELALFFKEIVTVFDKYQYILSSKISNKDRKKVLDGIGFASSNYRTTIYEKGFTSKKINVSKSNLIHFFEITKKYLDQTIDANKRSDKLYHSYNLMTIENDFEISISRLSEMLEGQVAILNAGYISVNTALELLDSLRNSALFRPDQYSYLLYPNKELKRFVDKNNIPSKEVEKSALLKRLLKDGDSKIIKKDILGNYHFNGNFNNANSLKEAFQNLPKEEYQLLIEKDTELVLGIFENIFDHKSFTGRSGKFFGYEGLGSIYWHMVAKLLFAVQETCIRAIDSQENKVLIDKLLDHYYEINEGIGVHKSPELYGAFPTDPYSHTPLGKGVQQPGMTGQVKEDILSRFGELGVVVKDGILQFKPSLLKKDEFLTRQKVFKYIDVKNVAKEIVLEKNSLCFTYCQIPIVYQLDTKDKLTVVFSNRATQEFESLCLDSKTSKQIFEREGIISKIVISLKNIS